MLESSLSLQSLDWNMLMLIFMTNIFNPTASSIMLQLKYLVSQPPSPTGYIWKLASVSFNARIGFCFYSRKTLGTFSYTQKKKENLQYSVIMGGELGLKVKQIFKRNTNRLEVSDTGESYRLRAMYFEPTMHGGPHIPPRSVIGDMT